MNSDCSAIVSAIDAIPFAEQIELEHLPLNCQIESSNLLCLVGPHRSQLRDYLRMLAGINRPRRGKVKILGEDSNLDQQAWRQIRTKIGYLSGVAPLLSTQHGLMNVMLPALYHRKQSYRETADQARKLLRELDCNFDLLSFPALLNNLQRLQLAMARALILDPALLILDVPFHDLGADEREAIGKLLGTYKQHRAVCMIGGLQYPKFLELHANQIIYISELKIICFKNWNAFMHSEDTDVQALLSGLKNVE